MITGSSSREAFIVVRDSRNLAAGDIGHAAAVSEQPPARLGRAGLERAQLELSVIESQLRLRGLLE